MVKKCSFLLGFLFILFIAPAYSAEVNISVNKNTLSQADTVQLSIEYNGQENKAPELGNLAQNFQIISQSSSQQMTFTNGQINQLKKWTLTLKPRKTGKITIKPIKIGDLSSNYLTVDVKEVTNVAFIPDGKENSNSPYFQIEQTVLPKAPYVQQQVTLLITVYDSLGLQNGTINIDEDSQKQWVISPLLDKPIIKQEKINGKYMNVATFAFAAFPQKSGKIPLPRFTFNGYYLKDSQIDFPEFDDFIGFGLNFRQAFGEKVPVNMQTKNEEITVLPIPDTFTGKFWLPVKQLQISSTLDKIQEFKVNDAINRQIIISAIGLQEKMIPQIDLPQVNGIKQYPEKPEYNEQVINGDIVATSTFNVVYIPTETGKFILPALEIKWFNIETKQVETAILPEETIIVSGNTPYYKTKTNTLPEISQTSTQKEPVPQVNTPQKEETTAVKSTILQNLYALIGGGILLLLFFVKYLFFKKEKNPYYPLVVSAIKKHDFKSARNNLINWAKIKYKNPNISNLDMVAKFSKNNEFNTQLHTLNELLYSGSDINFSSAKFVELFKKVDKIKHHVQKNDKILPNLYD